MKRTPFKRRVSGFRAKPREISELRSKTIKGLSKKKATVKRKIGGKNKKLPSLKSLRTKCDNLLTPIIQKKYPYCLLRGAKNCAGVTQVAHHHVHKSKSSRLRYDLQNLIPLCGSCHVMLHNDESFWGAKVAQIKGPEWFVYIERAKHETVQTDRYFYTEHYERLLREI